MAGHDFGATYSEMESAAARLRDGRSTVTDTLKELQGVIDDLVQGLCARLARLPVMPAPDVPIQPVDVEEVASRLAELAVGPPSERVPDLGGPQVETFEELARTYLESVGSNKRLWPVNPPGAIMAAARSGGLLAPDRAAGGRTFAEFMAGTSTIPAPR